MKIFSDDPQALEKLQNKLSQLEEKRKFWKTIKKCKPRRYDGSLEDRKWYEPQLINQEIGRIKKRIEKIQSLQNNNIQLERIPVFKNGKKFFKYQEVKL